MEILPYGDDAVLVNFEQNISDATNAKVIDLAASLTEKKGVFSIIPSFCSLTVLYDRKLFSLEQIKELIATATYAKKQQTQKAQKLHIPVCYEDEYGLDLPKLSTQLSLDKEEIIQLHTQKDYKVYMIGFLPGFPYMGTVDERIQVGRKSNPRKSIAAGSVGLAGQQTGIYPFSSPGGWQIIGKTPLPLFEPSHEKSFLFNAGDVVKFSSINKDEFKEINRQIEQGAFNWEQVYE